MYRYRYRTTSTMVNWHHWYVLRAAAGTMLGISDTYLGVDFA